VQVSWQGVSGASVYSVFRSVDGGPYVNIALVGADGSGNTYLDGSANSGSSLLYQVQASSYSGQSEMSASASTPAPYSVDPMTGLPYWFESDEGDSSLPNPPTQPPSSPTGPAGASPPVITLTTPPNATLQ
jgi:hypothetical protein